MAADTWSSRELPLLEIALREVDQGHNPSFEGMAEEAGIELRQTCIALKALKNAGYLDGYFAAGDGGMVMSVSEKTRRALGSWPTADSIVDRMALALATAAEIEPDPAKKGVLSELASGLKGVGRTVAVETLSAVVRHSAGLP